MNLTGIEDAHKPIFFCSFGKDSSSILHALKPYLHKTLVAFIDCGATYPDVTEFARGKGKSLPLFLYHQTPGDFWTDVREKGFPVGVDIPEISGFAGETLGFDPFVYKHKIRPWTHCIYERVWLQVNKIVEDYKPDLFISGERSIDRPFAKWQDKTGGETAVKTLRPIFDWSDEDVWEYVEANKIELPLTFQGKQKDRRDCWACLGGHDFTPGRIKELKEDWPDLYHKLFIEEGFSEVLPQIEKHLKAQMKILAEVKAVIYA